MKKSVMMFMALVFCAGFAGTAVRAEGIETGAQASVNAADFSEINHDSLVLLWNGFVKYSNEYSVRIYDGGDPLIDNMRQNNGRKFQTEGVLVGYKSHNLIGVTLTLYLANGNKQNEIPMFTKWFSSGKKYDAYVKTLPLDKPVKMYYGLGFNARRDDSTPFYMLKVEPI